MGKIRVYELAKELNKSTKEMMEILNNMGVDIKSHMSTVDEKAVDMLQQQAQQEKQTQKAEAAPKSGQPKKSAKPKPAKPKAVNDEEQLVAKPEKIKKKRGDEDVKKINAHNKNKSGNNRNKQVNNRNGKDRQIDEIKEVPQNEAQESKVIEIGSSITVNELADAINRSSAEVLKKLLLLGIMANINQDIDFDTASLVAGEFGIELKEKAEDEQIEEEEEEDPDLLKSRAPVVTVMGHVDHGKTSILDAIRETNVAGGEAGGITQHIGAYQIFLPNKKKVVFLDTPGHEAFTSMRARGAEMTDIAILVVAADDGVMPQTIEAIHHAHAAKVPIVVAINKMDKAGANPDVVKQQLTEHGLVPEDWGGDTICVPVSAKTQEGLDDLLEMILLVAEMQELKANPDRRAKGAVVEAELDKGRGPVATVLIQKGTLKVGQAIVAGNAAGKVRAMFNEKGERIHKAGPATPVVILGFSDVPQAGEIFQVVSDEKTARNMVEQRVQEKKDAAVKETQPVTLDDFFKQVQEGNIKELNIIIKADVQGSAEAMKQSLEKLGNEEVRVHVIHGAVGGITESDILLATASNAIIIGFNVRPDVKARDMAEREKVDIRLYRVIYDAIEDVKAALEGLLDPEYKEIIVGRVDVRATFKVPKVGIIAGCYVTEGKINNKSQMRVIRDNIVIFEGKIDSLKRFKEDAKEVVSGYECGISIVGYHDLREGDVLEAFDFEEIKSKLD